MQTNTCILLVCIALFTIHMSTAHAQLQASQLSITQLDSALNLTDLQEAEILNLMAVDRQAKREIQKLTRANPRLASQRSTERSQTYEHGLAQILSPEQWAGYRGMKQVHDPIQVNQHQVRQKKKNEKSGTGKQLLTGGLGFMSSELIRMGMKWLRRNRR